MNIFKIINDKFKQIINNQRKEENNSLEGIEIGDLIWAKRYSNLREKYSIIKGHREGPYIVIAKENDKLICAKGTSKRPKRKYQPEYYKIFNHEYNLHKETYFHLHRLKIVKPQMIIKQLDTLTKQTLKEIFQIIKLRRKNYYKTNNQFTYFKMPLNQGEIFKYDNKIYLVLDNTKDTILSLELPNKNYQEELTIDAFKLLNYSNTSYIENNEHIEYINTVNNKLLIYILKRYKEYLDYLKNKTIPQRGSIIKLDDKYYYIYGEEKQDFLVFKISKKNKTQKIKIKLQNQTFYTNFTDKKISKKTNFTIINLCTKDEIELIKEQRKKYKNTNQAKKEEIVSKKYKNEQIQRGSIIKQNELSLEELYVINVAGDILTCVGNTERNKYLQPKVYLNKNDIVLVENPKTKKRIK